MFTITGPAGACQTGSTAWRKNAEPAHAGAAKYLLTDYFSVRILPG
jgi:hypothetical protein